MALRPTGHHGADGDPNPAGVFALLLLADGRFPAGGHAHSGGVEAAVADGRVHDEASLETYVRGRLRTSGLVDAAMAAATVLRLADAVHPDDVAAVVRELDAETTARLAAPPLRDASRRLGRQLVRVASRCWPHPVLVAVVDTFPDGLHLAPAFGAVGVAAGLDAAAVARLVVHHAVTTPAQAAVRLLGLDPFAVAAATARAAGDGEDVVRQALAVADGPLADLPARVDPLVEIAAVEHQAWDIRMFAT